MSEVKTVSPVSQVADLVVEVVHHPRKRIEATADQRQWSTLEALGWKRGPLPTVKTGGEKTGGEKTGGEKT